MRSHFRFSLSIVGAANRDWLSPWLAFVAAIGISAAADAATLQRVEVLQGGVSKGFIDPYIGTLSAAANYHYDQPNGFPISGPASAAFQGRIFFYEGLDGLHFNVIFNTQALGRGTVDWTMSVAGSTTNPSVKVTDDPDPPADHVELIESPSNFFTGAWSYVGNTDGGVIGPLAGASWSLTVNQIAYTSDNDRGIDTLRAYDDSGSFISLNLNSGSTGQLVFRPEVVPEPSTFAMAMFGLTSFVVCIGMRRRV
jgi:hypothetical protein